VCPTLYKAGTPEKTAEGRSTNRLFRRKSKNGSNVTNYDASNFSAPAYFKKLSLAKLYALKI
jgi:hypothetical protein